MGQLEFEALREEEIARSLVREFLEELVDHLISDVVVVGAGPAGLTAARYLARGGAKTLIVEQNAFAGGGMWSGGYLFPKLIVEAPADEVLREVGVRLKEVGRGMFVTDPAEVVAKSLSAALEAGAKFLNNTTVEDVIFREDEQGKRIEGVVVNWFPVSLLPANLRFYDPIMLRSKFVIDATGHGAKVTEIVSRKVGGIELKGERAMDVPRSERLIVERTGEIMPGLIVAGMAVAAVHGLPRMGPIFGGMFLSGRRAAEIALKGLGLA